MSVRSRTRPLPPPIDWRAVVLEIRATTGDRGIPYIAAEVGCHQNTLYAITDQRHQHRTREPQFHHALNLLRLHKSATALRVPLHGNHRADHEYLLKIERI